MELVRWRPRRSLPVVQDEMDRAFDRLLRNWWTPAAFSEFDWNPSVEVIGAQGTYFVIGYSESQNMAGATRLIGIVPERIGFVPEQRFLVGFGEWVLDGVRVAFEYSHIVDYSVREGGTGHSADGIFGMLTYEW